MRLPVIASPEDLTALVQALGFLPFFRGELPGFSVEECVDRRFWFPREGDGVWEWKGPVIRAAGCAYGKFFAGKAGFISMDYFPDFANVRRRGYDFDALYDDGFARRTDLALWQAIAAGPQLTGALKPLVPKGFDGAITRLQAQCYAVVDDFVYRLDRHGRAYGWGVARYATPETKFGAAFTDAVYARTPEAAEDRVLTQLSRILPEAGAAALGALLHKGRAVTGS